MEKGFQGKLISNKLDFICPPRSPDLNPLDFFLWGYLKSRVFANKPKTIEELISNIRTDVANIPAEMIKEAC